MISTTERSSIIPKTLIFSQTKDDVDKFAVFYVPHLCINVSMHHASQSEETKAFIQSTFQSSMTESRCLSATIAFGMVCQM